MKLFKDKKTSEMFMQLNEIQVMSLHDNGIYDMSLLDLEVVDVSPKNPALYEVDTIKRERFSVGCLQSREWHLKEILIVPVGDKMIPFRVEHITDEKVYFVAVDIIGNSSMNDMNKYLDDFMEKLPKELLDICDTMEHKVNGALVRRSKVTLLSRANLTKCEACNGKDDILFDGLQTEAERCKNDSDGETKWYWQDTPYNYEDITEDSLFGNSTYFWNVFSYGNVNYNYASYSFGVVPAFSILLKKELH